MRQRGTSIYRKTSIVLLYGLYVSIFFSISPAATIDFNCTIQNLLQCIEMAILCNDNFFFKFLNINSLQFVKNWCNAKFLSYLK